MGPSATTRTALPSRRRWVVGAVDPDEDTSLEGIGVSSVLRSEAIAAPNRGARVYGRLGRSCKCRVFWMQPVTHCQL